MITISQFIEIERLEKNNEYEINLISIVYDLDPSEIDLLDADDYIKKIRDVDTMLAIRRLDRVSQQKYQPILDIITFGEYIDLEEYQKSNNWNRFCQSFYGIKESLSEEPISILFYAQDKFAEYQRTIFGNYSSLFGDDESEDDYDENPIDQEAGSFTKEAWTSGNSKSIKRFADVKEENRRNIQQKWGWILIAFNLAKNDITKLDKVLELKMTYVLNILLLIRENNIDLNPNAFPMV